MDDERTRGREPPRGRVRRPGWDLPASTSSMRPARPRSFTHPAAPLACGERRNGNSRLGWPHGRAAGTEPPTRDVERRAAVPRDPAGAALLERAGELGARAADRHRLRHRGGKDDPAPTDEDQRGFEEAVRLAELQVASFTGLEPPTDVATVEAVRRAKWVQANLEGLRSLIEPSAAKVAGALAKMQLDAAPDGGAGIAGQMIEQLAPLLLGAQVGAGPGLARTARAGSVRHRRPARRASDGCCSSFRTSPRSNTIGAARADRVPHVGRRCTRSRTGSSSQGRGRCHASARCWRTSCRRSSSTSLSFNSAWSRSTPRTRRRCKRMFEGDEGLVRRRPRRGAAAEARPHPGVHGSAPRATATTLCTALGRTLLPDLRQDRGRHAPLPESEHDRPGVRAPPRASR